MKGVPFSINGSMKGIPFLFKWNSKGLDLQVEPPHVKLCKVAKNRINKGLLATVACAQPLQ